MKFEFKRQCRHAGKVHAAGDKITSPHPLAESWPDRFRLVEDGALAASVVIEPEGVPQRTGRKRGRKAVVAGVADASKATTLRAVPKGGGKYDVVNTESGKAINAEPLTQEEANHLVGGGADAGGKQTGDGPAHD